MANNSSNQFQLDLRDALNTFMPADEVVASSNQVIRKVLLDLRNRTRQSFTSQLSGKPNGNKGDNKTTVQEVLQSIVARQFSSRDKSKPRTSGYVMMGNTKTSLKGGLLARYFEVGTKPRGKRGEMPEYAILADTAKTMDVEHSVQTAVQNVLNAVANKKHKANSLIQQLQTQFGNG
ncbi:hypothetical protein Barb4_03351 [Bacteroidales bacterium Barb4]|nr:hypothetical protein Barb4_03351 [Bacteroidales bacterium Barb4]